MSISTSGYSARFPFMQQSAQGASLHNAPVSAKKMGISYAESPEQLKVKTVAKVLSKKKIEKVIDYSNLIITIQGIAKTIVVWISTVIDKTKGISTAIKKNYLKFKGASSLPFNALDLVMSIYSCYDDTVHAYKTHKIHDGEGTRLRSSSLFANMLNIASIGTGFASFAHNANGSLALSATVGVASSALGVGAFGVMALLQANTLKHVARSAQRFSNAFSDPDKDSLQKYKDGLQELCNQVQLTEKDISLAYERAFVNGTKPDIEIAAMLREKHNRLERRVGKELALEIEAKVDHLQSELNCGDLPRQKEAAEGAHGLFIKYREAINLEISLRSLKVVGATLGAIACGLSISCPVGAGVVFGVSAIILGMAWYGDGHWKGKRFTQNNILRLYDRYEIPTPTEVFPNSFP